MMTAFILFILFVIAIGIYYSRWKRDVGAESAEFLAFQWIPKVFTQPHIIHSSEPADSKATSNNTSQATRHDHPAQHLDDASPNTPARPRLFTPPPERDDLKKVKGIGPVMEQTLNELGVTSFQQLGSFTPTDIERVSEALGEFPDRIERDEWVTQAKRLHEEKYGTPL